MLTLREVFDKVKAHMLAQGARSAIGGLCAYRGDAGAKCAVGCLITDEAYSSRLEGKGVYNDPVVEALNKSDVPTDDCALSLLDRLQRIHDGSNPERWPERLDVAERDYAISFASKAAS